MDDLERGAARGVLLLVAVASLAIAGVYFLHFGADREEVLDALLRAKALFDDGKKWDRAEPAFERVLELDTDQPEALLGAALSGLRNSRDYEAVRRRVLRFLEVDPGDPAGLFALAVVQRQLHEYEQALETVRRVREAAPDDLDVAYYELCVLRDLLEEEQAIERAHWLLARDPTDPVFQYTLGQLLRRRDPERSAELVDAAARQREKISEAVNRRNQDPWTVLWPQRLERLGVQPQRVHLPPLEARLVDAGARAGLPDSGVSALDAADLDGDCIEDLVLAGRGILRGTPDGRFVARDVGDALAAWLARPAVAVLALDLDDDRDADLLFASPDGCALFLNQGDGTLEPAAGSGLEGLRALGVRAVDYDHEGDVDLLFVVADGDATALRLMRNDLPPSPDAPGAPTPRPSFTDVTEEAGLAHRGARLVLAPCDVENHNDVDVVALDRAAPGALFSNQRLGRFREIGVAADVAPLRALALVAADLDGDAWPDLAWIAPDGGLYVARNRGDGTFADPGLVAALAPDAATGAALAVLDVDNDGDLELAAGDAAGLHLFRNDRGTFADATAEAGIEGASTAVLAALVALDLDRDGDEDLLVLEAGGAVRLFDNPGTNGNRALIVFLDGQKSNDAGIGSKIDVRHGDLWVRREAWRFPLTIGVGPFEELPYLGVWWPNGVRQTAFGVTVDGSAWMAQFQEENGGFYADSCVAGAIRVQQIERTDGSCPLLYAFDGERFRFVTDVLCSSPLGLDLGGGVRALPNPEDAVTIRPDQLAPRAGRYELRFTEELREITYLDRTRLLCVDHPADVEVHTDNKFVFPPAPPFALHLARDRRPLRSATDDAGADVLAALAARDRVYVDGFTRCRPPMQGMAAMHDLFLDLGDVPATGAGGGPPRVRLFLEGWFWWTNSSINRALAQDGSWRFTPPQLAVGDGRGGWREAGELGIPAGGTKMVVTDLTGRLDPADPRVRIRTNLQVYWDLAFVSLDDAPEALAHHVTELAPSRADLRWRGYSRRTWVDGRWPIDFDYHDLVPAELSYEHQALRHRGRFTRYGDVRELLDEADDRFVILDHGDEIALAFDAAGAPPPRDGWTRTFVLRSFGWAKDGDHHSATADAVLPLPFAAMSAYPPPPGESYPDDAVHRRYRAEWNTRERPREAAAPRHRPRRPAALPPEAQTDHLVFTEVAQAAGIDFRHAEGRVLENLEDTMGAGCALGDVDGDGDDDIYFVQGSGPGGPDVLPGAFTNRLYRNDGGLRFTDVTEWSGTGDTGFGMGALFADLDGDGDQDLYVTNLGANVLYRNDGDGRFTDVTVQSGTGDRGFGAGVAAGDYDRDGDLDLYVGNYVVVDPANRPTEAAGFSRGLVRDDPPSILPMAYPPARNVLFRNDGNLLFTDVTDQAGVADAEGKTLGVLFLDLDHDGWPDLFCANDVSLNSVFQNRGDGTFEAVAFDVGLDDPRGGMGVAAFDADGDADFDLAVTYWQTEPNALYRNNLVRHASKKRRVPSFEDVAHRSGFARAGIGVVSWGIEVADFDHDGAQDALIANGYTSPDYETTTLCQPQRPLFLRGDGGGGFVESNDPRFGAFLSRDLNGRGLAASDLDRDGDLDVVLTQNNGRALLLRNDGGHRGAWLQVDLAGTASPADPAGARVEVALEGGRVLARPLVLGASYLCGNSKTLHFGLGRAETHEGVTVHWPSGRTSRLEPGPARRRVVIREPGGE